VRVKLLVVNSELFYVLMLYLVKYVSRKCLVKYKVLNGKTVQGQLKTSHGNLSKMAHSVR